MGNNWHGVKGFLTLLAPSRPPPPRILAQLDRYLRRDRIIPSFGNVVSATCLRALTAIAERQAVAVPAAAAAANAANAANAAGRARHSSA